MAKRFYPQLVAPLTRMLQHEKKHLQAFDSLLKQRKIKPCYALTLWAIGGYLLGLITALLGKNAIWICTHAVESTVLTHLKHQLYYLAHHDRQLYDVVLSIEQDEQNHHDYGLAQQQPSWLNKPIYCVVSMATTLAIGLSTRL